MAIIDEWISPQYLEDRVVEGLRQSIQAKPVIKYAVVDGLFRPSKLDELIRSHQSLTFSVEQDRVRAGKVLPYDGAVKFAQHDDFGAELFFDQEWHRYLCYVTGTKLEHPVGTEVKLRRHRPFADGFWIHTDSTLRDLVVIAYFNQEWTAGDGGLLQLWRVDEELSDKAYRVDDPKGRMDFLTTNSRISTMTPGGGFSDGQRRDLTLIDQIVPAYNRAFLCGFQEGPAYHSVTPSCGKERTGFVQWLFNRKREL